MRHEIVFCGCEDVVAFAQPETAVYQADTHGGAVGQRDVRPVDAEMLAGRFAHFSREPRIVRLQVLHRIPVEARAVPLDRLTHRSRVRGQKHCTHVDSIGRKLEEIAHLCPVLPKGGCLCRNRLTALKREGRGRGRAYELTPRNAHASSPDLLAMANERQVLW
jgi:hypothetical protein